MDFNEAREMALAFRTERDWGQFHNEKDLAISLNLETAELLEVFQWSGERTRIPEKRDKIAEELADVFIYGIYLAEECGLDIPEIVARKVQTNASKYPVEKARGRSEKYDEL